MRNKPKEYLLRFISKELKDKVFPAVTKDFVMENIRNDKQALDFGIRSEKDRLKFFNVC